MFTLERYFGFHDLFGFFRIWLGWIVTVYFGIITAQSLWGWYKWLAGGDRYISLLRRYLLVHGLRLRFRAFWGDVIICALLMVAFFMLWHAQLVMDQIERTRTPNHVARAAKHS